MAVCFLVEPSWSKIDGCNSASTCSQCIRIPDCVWCFSKEVDAVRCSHRRSKAHCPADYIIDPKSQFFILGDEPLTTAKGVEDPVQLRPQMASLSNMRVGKEIQSTSR